MFGSAVTFGIVASWLVSEGAIQVGGGIGPGKVGVVVTEVSSPTSVCVPCTLYTRHPVPVSSVWTWTDRGGDSNRGCLRGGGTVVVVADPNQFGTVSFSVRYVSVVITNQRRSSATHARPGGAHAPQRAPSGHRTPCRCDTGGTVESDA